MRNVMSYISLVLLLSLGYAFQFADQIVAAAFVLVGWYLYTGRWPWE